MARCIRGSIAHEVGNTVPLGLKEAFGCHLYVEPLSLFSCTFFSATRTLSYVSTGTTLSETV